MTLKSMQVIADDHECVITGVDVDICTACGEHAEFCEECGSTCCGAGSPYMD